jgi:hypothetical protein
MVQINNTNRYLHDRTVAYRATHQAMEVLLAEDLDSMLLQDGNTFAVLGTSGGSQVGSITVTDLNWGLAGDPADKAYMVRLEVPTLNVVLTAVRTRT